jgi:hypothetical protein
MSAIVAGACRHCGKQFWVSLGHPAWFKAYLKTRHQTEDVRRFLHLQDKRICPDCAPSDYAPYLK